MVGYFIQRFFIGLPTLIGISILVFLLTQLTPGGPVEQAIAQLKMSGISGEASGNILIDITAEQREALVKYYGFDKPVLTRYFLWIAKLIRFDFGESYYYEEPVWPLLKQRLPVSITFGVVSFFATYLVCIPLGILKAIRHNTKFDFITSSIIFFLYSIPQFALAIVLIVLFGGGSFWDLFPIEGFDYAVFDEMTFFPALVDLLWHMVLPLTCFVIRDFAMLTMLMKNSLLEQIKQDYITTARAKGVKERQVVLKHALRNALLPVASGFGQWISFFFSGSLLIETIFNIQGIGRLSYESIVYRDYPVVLAIIMILSVLYIVGNILSDLIYVLIDPRIDFS